MRGRSGGRGHSEPRDMEETAVLIRLPSSFTEEG